MRIEWSALVLLAAEFTFAVLFLRALAGYLRRRDSLQGNVTLVFLPCTVVFCLDITRRLGGDLPAWVTLVSTTALLAQPYLTVRLASRLRHVPRRLDRLVLCGYVALAVPIIMEPRPLDTGALITVVLGFGISEAIPAALLFGKARTRAGANRARLMTAAAATLAFSVMVLFIGLNGLWPG